MSKPFRPGSRAALACALASLVLACSHTDSPPERAKSAAGGSGDSGSTATGLETLITGDWTMAAGSEGYVCARKTVDEDLYVHTFAAINPPGTHHTLLTMGDPTAPDGVTDCTAADNQPLSVFGTGVGTSPLTLPDGLAIRIPKGKQLLLNLHLFNTGGTEISGTSGTRVGTMPESDVTHVAEGLLAGTTTIDIPPGATKTTIGHCTMSTDSTIVAVAPHMHKLGIHERVVAEKGGGEETVLLDADYDFNDQSYRLIDPISLPKGDRLRIECTHRNTTTHTVTFGQSTLSEMCFAGVYRYPADGSLFICVDPPSDAGAPSDAGTHEPPDAAR